MPQNIVANLRFNKKCSIIKDRNMYPEESKREESKPEESNGGQVKKFMEKNIEVPRSNATMRKTPFIPLHYPILNQNADSSH